MEKAGTEAMLKNVTPEIIHRNLSVCRNPTTLRKNVKTPFLAVKMLDTYSGENEIFREMFRDVADEIYIDKPHNWVSSDEKNFTGSLYGAENRDFSDDLRASDTGVTSCCASFYTLAVRNNGDVVPCCVDYAGGTNNIGNINDIPLKELWQGNVMREFLKMQLSGENFKNPSCRSCRIYKSSYYARDNVDGVPIEKLQNNTTCGGQL